MLLRGGAAVIVAIVILLVYLAINRGLNALYRHKRIAAPIVISMRKLLRWLTVVVSIVVLLQVFGLLENAWASLTAILAMIAIGFVAMWSILSNTLCSVILLVVRPFNVGDSIEFPPDPVKGRVVNFTLLYTTLRTADGAFVQVPNNMFFQRMYVRTPGDTIIDLDEQLMEKEDARV
jgi:small-conductance mechanosensitive channel